MFFSSNDFSWLFRSLISSAMKRTKKTVGRNVKFRWTESSDVCVQELQNIKLLADILTQRTNRTRITNNFTQLTQLLLKVGDGRLVLNLKNRTCARLKNCQIAVEIFQCETVEQKSCWYLGHWYGGRNSTTAAVQKLPDSRVSSLIQSWKGIWPPKSCSNTHG